MFAFVCLFTRIQESFPTRPLKGHKNSWTDLALRLLPLHFTHSCSAESTHTVNSWIFWEPGGFCDPRKKPYGHMYTRIQERISGNVNQELRTTERATADPTRAALRCHQLPAPSPCPWRGERLGISDPLGQQWKWRKTGKPPQAAAFWCSSFLRKGSTAPALGDHRGSIMGAAGAGSHNYCWSTPISAASCSQVYLYINEYILCSLFLLEMTSPCLFLDYHLFNLTAPALEIHGTLIAIV